VPARQAARIPREPAPRHPPALARVDARGEVIERQEQPQPGADLQIGRVGSLAVHGPVADPAVGAVEMEVEVDEIGAHRRVARAVEPARGGREQRRREAHERPRNGQVGTLAVGHQRARSPPQPPPRQTAGQRLQHLIAPALGLLDDPALGAVAREQGRVGDALLQAAEDRARAEDMLPVLEHDAGDGLPAEAPPLLRLVRHGDHVDLLERDVL
jgi:hypothetical protein